MSTKEDSPSVQGSCLCGMVRFEVRLPSKWCAHCHCRMCRKAHGAGYVTWAGFEEVRFSLHDETGALRWYESSPGARRGFCGTCGSTLFFASERWPGEIHVAVGSLDEPLDRTPQANVFFETHVDWMPVDGALPAISSSE
jgi:hypothetical protein